MKRKTTKPRRKTSAVTITLEALEKARKVAKKRKESVSHYLSTLILKEL